MERQVFSDDQELIREIRDSGDLNAAIHAMYRQYAEAVQAFIMGKGANRQDAEDIFQETIVAFISVVKNGKFRQESSVKTFLTAVARNLWLNSLNKKMRTERREKLYESGTEKEEQDISHLMAEREARQQLREMLNGLGDPCRKILVMFYYDNLSMKEMVEKLPYENEQVVRNKKYKCLQQLTGMIRAKPGLVAQMKELLK